MKPINSAAPPTAQQEAALEAAGSVVLSSGAGCGKTFVLTRRFLGYLREGFSVGDIVAITFTERAARDMRSRIRSALQDRVNQEPGGKWEEHLRDLESATITTIHSFCGNLVRQHATRLGIDPRFEILEEMLSVNLMDDAIRHAMQDLVIAENTLGDACRELVVIYGWSETLKCVSGLVRQRDFAAWEAWINRSAPDIAAEWLKRYRQQLVQSATTFFSSNADWLRAKALLETHRSLNPKVLLRLSDLLQKANGIESSTDLTGDLDAIRKSALIHLERAKAWETPEIYKEVLDALKEFRDRFDKCFDGKLDEPEDVEKIAEVALQFLRIAIQVGKSFQLAKQQKGVLDFDDLLALAHQLLSSHSEVLRQVRDRHQRLLLDEMQDTDPVQMGVVHLLAGNSRVENRLFAVGDVKQSIYRFRGAEVGLFAQLRESVPESNRLPLTANFRSQPPILEFVNALFTPVFRDYEPLTTLATPIKQNTCVEFWWSFHDDEQAKADELRTLEAGNVARRLRAIIDEAQPLIALKDGSTRPATQGDMVILFRSMSNVSIYEEALRKEGLDYYIVGGRAFFAQQEVYDILNLLKALENPDDTISLIGALRSPLGALSDDTLLALGRHRAGIWEALSQSAAHQEITEDQLPRVTRIANWLSRWRQLKDRLPIASLLNQIMDDAGYDAALQFESLGDRKLANLWKLIEMARKFDQAGMFHLSDFIRQLSAMVSRELREEQAATQTETANVVRIMSVHQSKGLEFPIVILPEMAAKKNSGHRGRVWWDRDLGCIVKPPDEKPPLFGDFAYQLASSKEKDADHEEEARIFYVATTRAKDLLILSGSFTEPFPTGETSGPMPLKSNNPWLEILNEQFELSTGKCFSSMESPRLVSVKSDTIEASKTKTKRAGTNASDIVDGRQRMTSEIREEIIIEFDRIFSRVTADNYSVAIANLDANFEAGQSAVIVRVKRNDAIVLIAFHLDGMSGEAVVVSDNRKRGLVRLGLASMANDRLGLKLFDIDRKEVESISPGEAREVAERWLDTLSLEINADAE